MTETLSTLVAVNQIAQVQRKDGSVPQETNSILVSVSQSVETQLLSVLKSSVRMIMVLLL